jgi:hypothetical protein
VGAIILISEQTCVSPQLLGKRVKLTKPYRPEEDGWKYGKDWIGYEFSIIVEIISHEYDRQLRQTRPRNVSLHLFDQEGRLYVIGKRDTTPIPGFVDFHVTEFVLCLDNMSLNS